MKRVFFSFLSILALSGAALEQRLSFEAEVLNGCYVDGGKFRLHHELPSQEKAENLLIACAKPVRIFFQEDVFARKAGAPENKNVAVFATLLFLYPVSFFGFDLIVDTLYPFVSLCGILTTGWTAFNLIMRSRDKHAHAYACSASHSASCPCPAPSSAHSRAHSSTHVSSVVGADDAVAQTADKSVAAGGKFSVCAFRGRDRNRSRDVRGRDSHSHRRRNRLRDNRSRLRTPRSNTPLLRPRRG